MARAQCYMYSSVSGDQERRLSSAQESNALVNSTTRTPPKQPQKQLNKTMNICTLASTGSRFQAPLPNKHPNLQVLSSLKWNTCICLRPTNFFLYYLNHLWLHKTSNTMWMIHKSLHHIGLCFFIILLCCFSPPIFSVMVDWIWSYGTFRYREPTV